MKKEIIKIVLVILSGLFLEVFIFNFTYIKSRLDTSKEYNIEYSPDDMVKTHWLDTSETMISDADPQLILESVETFVDQISISFTANKPIDNVLLFYTNQKVKEINGELLIVNSEVGKEERLFTIRDYIGVLRIDPGEDAGVKFQNFKIIINPVNFNLSLSRVVAILLLYLLARALFTLQNPPDYGLERE